MLRFVLSLQPCAAENSPRALYGDMLWNYAVETMQLYPRIREGQQSNIFTFGRLPKGEKSVLVPLHWRGSTEP